MNFAAKDILKLADLANLKINSSEVDALSEKLSSILKYVEMIATFNADGSQDDPRNETPTMERADEVVPSLAPEKIIALAPEVLGTAFRVPRIIDGN